jgi:glycosyltransferase involved in cell wall biosynthesis
LAVSLDVSAIPANPAGAGRYVVELARALGEQDGVALTMVSRRRDAERWRALGPHSRVAGVVPVSRPARLFYEQWLLGPRIRQMRQPDIRVHHGPHYTLPRRLGEVASVVTIHDMTFFDHPEWHERTKVAFFKRSIRRAAAEADVLVCVSRTTAERCKALLKPKGEVVTAPHGVDHRRFKPRPGGDEAAAEDRELVRRAGCEPAPYVLHLGTIEPRKGVVDLIEAFDLLAGERPELNLVLAGIEGWDAGRVAGAIADSPYADRIVRLGYVDDAFVPALIRQAEVVAYPSYDEGFGLPALEALACGAPLVTSLGTPMADLAGAAAWTPPAGDPAALAAAVSSALAASPEERGRRREVGLERAARHTWEAAAAQHAAAYRLALG